MAGTPAQFAAEIKKRISNQQLVELTNDEGASTDTINDTVLESNTEDAMGFFQLWGGILPDITVKYHVALITIGTHWKLMDNRGLSAGVVDEREKSFYMKCIGIRKLTYTKAETSSPWKKTQPQEGTITVLDPSHIAMSGRIRNQNRFSETRDQ